MLPPLATEWVSLRFWRLVQERAGHILSIQNLVTRNTGQRLSGNRIKTLTEADVEALLPEGNRALPVQTNLALMRSLDQQIAAIEASLRHQVRPRPEYKLLQSVAGVGEVLGQTILLETGTIERFPGPGQYASYCRCVRSERQSNGKKKGTNNRKNGNRYLAWAFTEAASFAIRYNTAVKRYYQRKQAKRCQPVAFKAVAHKLARATYHVLRTGEPFETERAFGS